MIMHKAFRFRLRMDAAQEGLALQTAGCRRLVYNLCLEQRSTWGQKHRISSFDQINELPALKAAFPFLKEVPSHCLQQAVRDLQIAYDNFFSGRAGYPTFKKRNDEPSFRFPDAEQFTISDKWIWLPKFGFVEWERHRNIVGKPKNVTIVREGNWWYASIACEVEEDLPEPGSAGFGEYLGIDLGISEPVMLSTGESMQIARTPEREKKRERQLRKKLSRQRQGSKNHDKTVRRLRALKAGQKRRRLDNAHKVSARVAREHSHVAMEDLRLLNMTSSAKGTAENPGKNVAQKAGLNRALLDLAHGKLRVLVQRKVERAGGTFVPVDPRNTSRRCNPCGFVSKNSRKSQAEFKCVSCGHVTNADYNASLNICEVAFGHQANNSTGGRPGLACGSSGVARRKQEQSSLETALAS